MALASYGLSGATIEILDGAEDFTFSVHVLVDSSSCHPYLGNVADQRFVLRVRSSGEHDRAASLKEAEWLAALLRDTELVVPEPVPACDGSLLAKVWDDRLGELYSLLYRWRV
jgi:Ser/Thr protein kinase RdoA (MazF antagonist)